MLHVAHHHWTRLNKDKVIRVNVMEVHLYPFYDGCVVRIPHARSRTPKRLQITLLYLLDIAWQHLKLLLVADALFMLFFAKTHGHTNLLSNHMGLQMQLHYCTLP